MQLKVFSSSNSPRLEGVPEGMLDSSSLLPSQLRKYTDNLTPERRLMMAVFFQTIGDIFDYEEGKQINEDDYRDAREWLMSENGTDFLSFENICLNLGYDSDYIRRLIFDRVERRAFYFRRMYEE